MEYVHQHYPAARYHRTLPTVQVENPEEDEALGEGWEATPAAFCPHHEHAAPGDTHCPKCALALPAAREAAAAVVEDFGNGAPPSLPNRTIRRRR